MMTAILCPAHGGPEVLQVASLPRPAPGAGEVLIRVCAAGINFPDILSVAGTYPIPSQPPFVPGIEGAGIVEVCGPQVARLRPGDRVCWQDNRRKGAFAEYLALPNVFCAGGSWVAPDALVQAQDWKAISDLARKAIAASGR